MEITIQNTIKYKNKNAVRINKTMWAIELENWFSKRIWKNLELQAREAPE